MCSAEHDLAARSDRRYAILMVDIDNLKAINDDFGHTAGNRAITLVADSLLRVTRSTDIVARYGGDEFIVFLAMPISTPRTRLRSGHAMWSLRAL